MLEMMKRFVRDEEGVTAIEYGLIAALIAVVIIGSVEAVGVALKAVFDAVAAAL
ncbi:Flp family type IVb pilin [Thauera aromatica]|uniref:Flp pilus assembly protein, pilin Flp n=1 Tax=Thauera aromatica K172 TaxID=44139 RepID=A0A2R4BR15_THAAR|nr:Flp family type IVb pilin [Thauera aromatica]AVR89643.1 Flp pilus assembly protein, pilin Flp [Thauera aromatica K172]